ncbi:MAG: AzlD domain-containing protein [Erysipelotrichaceae bacterium]|nr:AzlD domain-containing protein [Erysipelotrichaceae bacterium]
MLGQIIVTSLVTIAVRFFPFIALKDKKSELIPYLSNVLPPAVMAMLVVYCLKGIDLSAAPFGSYEICGVLVTALLQVWKRNTLLSILGGTIVYMILIRGVLW